MAELGAATSRVVTVRLTDAQYHHLVVQAHLRDVSISEALRRALERDIDAQPDLGSEEDPRDRVMGYRAFLGVADFTAAVQELQARDDAEA